MSLVVSERICKNQGRKFLADTAHAKAVLSVGIVRVHTATIEVHLVRVGRAVLRRRPIVAPRTGILQRTGRVVAVTDSGKLYSRRLHHAVRDVVPGCLVSKSVCKNQSRKFFVGHSAR